MLITILINFYLFYLLYLAFAWPFESKSEGFLNFLNAFFGFGILISYTIILNFNTLIRYEQKQSSKKFYYNFIVNTGWFGSGMVIGAVGLNLIYFLIDLIHFLCLFFKKYVL